MLYTNVSLLPDSFRGGIYSDQNSFKIKVMPDISPCEIRGMRKSFSILPCLASSLFMVGRVSENRLYMILSSYRDDASLGHGSLMMPLTQEKHVIYGGRHYQNNDCFATYDVAIVVASPGDVFWVNWSGYMKGYSPTYYVVEDTGKVMVVEQEMIRRYYATKGKEVPFSLSKAESLHGFPSIIPSEWKTVV